MDVNIFNKIIRGINLAANNVLATGGYSCLKLEDGLDEVFNYWGANKEEKERIYAIVGKVLRSYNLLYARDGEGEIRTSDVEDAAFDVAVHKRTFSFPERNNIRTTMLLTFREYLKSEYASYNNLDALFKE